MVSQPGFRIALGRCKKSGKKRKGSNFIANETTHGDRDLIKEKDSKRPILVSQLGITEPNPSTRGSLWRASNPVGQVVEVGLGVDVGYPL